MYISGEALQNMELCKIVFYIVAKDHILIFWT